MVHNVAKIIATFFYIGKIRVAPGTFGSLPAFAICYMILYFVENNKIVFNISGLNFTEQLIISTFLLGLVSTFILFVIGTISTYIYIQDKADDDPKEVVIDEVVGQMLMIVLTAISILFVYSSTMPQFYNDFTLKFIFLFLLPFALFRLFDIVKPWPIGWLDQTIKGALGIMIDDIAAALFATVIHFAITLFILDFYKLPEEVDMAEDNKAMLEIVADIKKNATSQKVMIATAESCTGGMLSSALTMIDGSSKFFDRGFITYSNAAKEQMLGVEPSVLKKFGAVSEETAQQMATGCLQHSDANLAISITGIAGPDGGTLQKPVGTVCFGVASSNNLQSYTFNFNGDRSDIRHKASLKALELIQESICSGLV